MGGGETLLKLDVPMKVLLPREKLKQRGRAQYFYHLPWSKLPIRDVLNAHGEGFKTEPHIENGSENFLKGCFQNTNIKQTIKQRERYMFLMTRCVNRDFHFNEKSIVGYIDINCYGRNTNGLLYVKGDTFLFSFEDAFQVEDLGWKRRTRTKNVDEETTEILLDHFSGLENITDQCIEEIKRFDKNGNTCFHDKGGFTCPSYEICPRYE